MRFVREKLSSIMLKKFMLCILLWEASLFKWIDGSMYLLNFLVFLL